MNSPVGLFNHLVIGLLCYVGFFRMVAQDGYYKLIIVFCHSMELMAHTIPFMLLQNYNNGFLAKYGKLELINMILSIVNIVLLGVEIYYM